MKSEYSKNRSAGDVIIQSDLISNTIVGFENHFGKTVTGDAKPLGTVVYGSGNNGEDKKEGIIYKNIIGTYLHGPLLPKNPRLAGEIVSAVVRAVPASVPVTVKIRKGWDESLVNAVEMAKIAEENGAAAITVHGRTREQFYSGKADLDIIKAVKDAVSIPVIGNGDIAGGESAKRMLDYTGCDAIMIGRGAQGNPWIFAEVLHFLKTGEKLSPPTIKERAEKMTEHLELLVKYKGEYRGIQEARKHISWYIKGMKGGARLREVINRAETKEDMLLVIEMMRNCE